jgi:hypothetical protein
VKNEMMSFFLERDSFKLSLLKGKASNDEYIRRIDLS